MPTVALHALGKRNLASNYVLFCFTSFQFKSMMPPCAWQTVLFTCDPFITRSAAIHVSSNFRQ